MRSFLALYFLLVLLFSSNALSADVAAQSGKRLMVSRIELNAATIQDAGTIEDYLRSNDYFAHFEIGEGVTDEQIDAFFAAVSPFKDRIVEMTFQGNCSMNSKIVETVIEQFPRVLDLHLADGGGFSSNRRQLK